METIVYLPHVALISLDDDIRQAKITPKLPFEKANFIMSKIPKQ